ncbi:MAG TPA: hypothetical protein VFW15_13280 [Thermoanaerobaculia bacterium]|jgi:hypothetical protein|nr:hypothetical protein [Thermoanaerobaculia bacterium]
MKVPFLPSVVPPHVFCLLAEGVTWANIRREPSPGFVESRHFPYPPNTLGAGPSGTPLFSREAIAEAVDVARKASGDRLSKASVVFPDSWARILPIDFDTLPATRDAVRDMVVWKLKKLLPGISEDLSVVFDEMPAAGDGGLRLLVAAAPSELLRSVEQAFENVGVRVGALAPASLALFEGLSPLLGSLAGGDYGLIHRSPGSLVFVIARDGSPVFFRQRPGEEGEEEQDQEVRLSLSYYLEKLHGGGLSAVYVHDALPGRELASVSALPVKATPISGRLFSADPGFDQRVAARPELLAAFAAVFGK